MDKVSQFYPKIRPIRSLNPGECFLVQYRDREKKELWIGVICSRDMISDEVWRHRRIGSLPKNGQWKTQLDRRHYPVYLPKKGKVIWVHFIHLFEIHRARYDEFDASPDYSEFCEVLNWVLEGQDITFWERMAPGEFKARKEMTQGKLQSLVAAAGTFTKRIQQISPPAQSNRENDGYILSDDSVEKPVAQVAEAAQTAKVPDSQERARCNEPLQCRVDVYIGTGASSKVYNMPRQCLTKSGFLERCLMTRNQSTIASDPVLDSTSHADFAVLLSFLKIGEYTPQLIASWRRHHHLEREPPPTAPNRGITFYLEGLVTHEEHEKEVLRCGYIYLLAQKFEIPALQALVLRKLRLGFPVISYKTMLTLVAYVFARLDANNHTVDPGSSPLLTGTPTAGAPPSSTLAEHHAKEEPLRAYLIEWLVVHMTAASRTEGRLYWDTVTVQAAWPYLSMDVQYKDW
ncbi:hypothetical protein BDBG_03128 [Blastomyces gilchristii SLH14081]|uniref:BTB domain-containing protein n=1 Tax=Blastomyces gilchristii (strain SLH14081) TaxID=559298 RepID=A0A179UJ16_BLAGS|nr:uncharacterized protein BDBG_03128 [Blastomyces gilchristii SLH14081]OAT07021.1 hypothetical protein BDBG_03128 [Blastomyces gilchristii SLH14081]